MSAMREFQYDTRTAMQKSGYETTDDILEGIVSGKIELPSSSGVGATTATVKGFKPQRQGKDLLESLVGLLLEFLVMLLWVSLKNLEKKQQIPYKVTWSI